ncbi:MAG: Zn-dependent protease [Spirochaetes bacterium]|nr:Zn-dependent protease [Spirochaetota bacterium]
MTSPLHKLSLVLFLALTPSLCAPTPDTDRLPIIALQPLGKVRNAVVMTAASGIEKAYHARVKVLPAEPLPARAYYRPRNRYRAEIILEILRNKPCGGCLKIAGITEADISTTKGKIQDWGIFGLATLDGRPCVISTFRLGRGGASTKLFSERLVKVVNHELGHTFGLDHCPTPGCIMEDAKGTIRTVDRESGRFCERCRKRLESRGVLR